MPSIKIQHQNRLNIRSKICMHDESGVKKKHDEMRKSMKENLYTHCEWQRNWIHSRLLSLTHTILILAEMCTVTYCGVCVEYILLNSSLFCFRSCKSLRVFPVYFPFQSVTFSLVYAFFLNAQESFAWKLNGIRILIWRYGATSLTLMLSLS